MQYPDWESNPAASACKTEGVASFLSGRNGQCAPIAPSHSRHCGAGLEPASLTWSWARESNPCGPAVADEGIEPSRYGLWGRPAPPEPSAWIGDSNRAIMSPMHESRCKAGRISARKSRQRALERYYQNPPCCLQCGAVLQVRGDEQCAAARKRRFCNQSCAASFNNEKQPKRPPSDLYCKSCGVKLDRIRLSSGNLSHPTRCTTCKSTPGSWTQESKACLFKRYIVFAAHAKIREHSRIVYEKSGKPRRCEVCGYTRHVEVCHRRGVAQFPDDALIVEINHIDNLVALCPTHHWEHDNPQQ